MAQGTERSGSCPTGWDGGSPTCTQAGPVADASDRALTERAAEFHGPDWVLGQTTMADLADGTLVVRVTASGRDSLLALATGDGLDPVPDGVAVDQPCVSISALCAHGDGLALIGSTPDDPPNVWLWSPDAAARPLRPGTGRASAAATSPPGSRSR